MSALHAAKRELRQKVKRILAGVSPNSVTAQTAVAVKNLLALPQYQDARWISVYLSMPTGEISTATIVNDAFESGKRVFVPYYYKREVFKEGEPASVMDMLELQSLQDYRDLIPDRWGIPTPGKDSISQRRNSFGSFGRSDGQVGGDPDGGLGLVVLPGMAFDRQLGRLGHGKGFYDFFLKRTEQQSNVTTKQMPFLVGLALKEQLLPAGENVPKDSTDWLVDAVIVGDGTVILPDAEE